MKWTSLISLVALEIFNISRYGKQRALKVFLSLGLIFLSALLCFVAAVLFSVAVFQGVYAVSGIISAALAAGFVMLLVALCCLLGAKKLF